MNKSESGIINLFAGYFNNGIATIKSFDITPTEIIENTYGNNQITFQGAAVNVQSKPTLFLYPENAESVVNTLFFV